jgi:hypothetical protein
VRSKGKILLGEIKGKMSFGEIKGKMSKFPIIDNAVYFLLCLDIQLGTV